MADEQHVVAMSRVEGSKWFMSIFDLHDATSGKEQGVKKTKKARFFLVERHIELAVKSLWLPVFLLDGWLVVPHKKELVWFDKKGKRSETNTKVDASNVQDIYSSGSSFLFVLRNKKLLLKQYF